MAYNANIPNPGDLLSVSQGDIKNNFLQANTSFGINHYPFDDGTANNGKHKKVSLPVTSDPANVLGEGIAYSKAIGIGTDAQLFWRFSSGAINPLQITNNVNNPASNNGAIPLMGGLILQYGTATTSAAATTVNFTNTFQAGGVATPPYGIFLTLRTGTPPILGEFTVDNQAAGSFQVIRSGPTNKQFFWCAIGPYN